jgi:hypothetical protein
MLSRQSTQTSAISSALGKYEGLWGQKEQTMFFRQNIPTDACDFTEDFHTHGLNTIFTNNVTTKLLGNFNCNHVYRQTKVMPDIIIFNDDKHVVFQPLGEPGRDLGDNQASKVSHLMVVTHSNDTPITLNEMLPTTHAENEDTHSRMLLMDSAYNALKRNKKVSKCGSQVIAKALSMGIPVTSGIREFMAKQISSFTDDFRGGRPGYKLMDASMNDIASATEEVILENINQVYDSKGLTIQKFIQGPDRCSQLISHIHGFLLPKGPLPVVISTNYINMSAILVAKGFSPKGVIDRDEVKSHSFCGSLCGVVVDDSDDEEMLARQLTNAKDSSGMLVGEC